MKTRWGTSLAVVLMIAAFAGCVGSEDLDHDPEAGSEDENQQSDAPSIEGKDLFGWVVDDGFDSLGSVNITVIGAPVNTTTSGQGFYAFESLPRQENLVVIAKHERFETQSKQVQLPNEGSILLNFTMEPKPTKTPYHEVLDFEGLLACQLVVEHDDGHLEQGENLDPVAQSALAGGTREQGSDDDEDRYKVDCGTADENDADRWEFAVGRDVAGVIVEVTWEQNTDMSSHFRLTLETDGHGGDDSILAQIVGPNGLLGQVNNNQAKRYYGDGGIVVATVEVDPNVHDEETGTGAAFAYQQDFTIHASVFYHEPPPSTYSLHAS